MKELHGTAATKALALWMALAAVIVDGATQLQPPPPLAVVPPRGEINFACPHDGYGIFADVSRGCQLFHVCQEGGRLDTYFCPNLTLFSQALLTCDWWYNVDCAHSEELYHAQGDLYDHVGIAGGGGGGGRSRPAALSVAGGRGYGGLRAGRLLSFKGGRGGAGDLTAAEAQRVAAHSGDNSLRDTNKYKSNYKTGGPGGIRPGSSSDLGNGYAISKGQPSNSYSYSSDPGIADPEDGPGYSDPYSESADPEDYDTSPASYKPGASYKPATNYKPAQDTYNAQDAYDHYMGAADPEDYARYNSAPAASYRPTESYTPAASYKPAPSYNQIPQSSYKSADKAPLEYADPEDDYGYADPEDYDTSYTPAASYKPTASYKQSASYKPAASYQPAQDLSEYADPEDYSPSYKTQNFDSGYRNGNSAYDDGAADPEFQPID